MCRTRLIQNTTHIRRFSVLVRRLDRQVPCTPAEAVDPKERLPAHAHVPHEESNSAASAATGNTAAIRARACTLRLDRCERVRQVRNPASTLRSRVRHGACTHLDEYGVRDLPAAATRLAAPRAHAFRNALAQFFELERNLSATFTKIHVNVLAVITSITVIRHIGSGGNVPDRKRRRRLAGGPSTGACAIVRARARDLVSGVICRIPTKRHREGHQTTACIVCPVFWCRGGSRRAQACALVSHDGQQNVETSRAFHENALSWRRRTKWD
jgi:hypothetical protein